jgi:site-specific DNA-methyltransferase (adenine-specific)
MGSGTTALAAAQLGRHSVGYEINPEFEAIIRSRFAGEAVGLVAEPALTFRRPNHPPATDWEAAIDRLPYRFRDPHALDVKIDPKQQTFGSKIDGQEAEIEYQRVRKVIAPDTVETHAGLRLRLLGVRVLPEFSEQATAFLEKTLKGSAVFTQTDPACPEVDGLPAVYLYLKNKTFVNAHLIKRGLVAVDDQRDYRHQQRFLKYSSNFQHPDSISTH